MKAKRPYETHGDKHRDIDEQIDQPFVVLVKQMDQGNKVDHHGAVIFRREHQGSEAAVFRMQRKIHEPGDDHDTQIYREEFSLVPPVDLSVFPGKAEPKQHPKHRDPGHKLPVGYGNHGTVLSK